MKGPVLRSISLCVLTAVAATGSGQITITAADVSGQLLVGTVLTNNSDTVTTSADIGSPGSTSWNFSGLSTHTTSTLTSVLVSSTPFASEFPGATHALQTTVVVSGITGTAYQYLILGAHLLNPGNKASGPLPPPFGTISLATTNSPVDTTYALPSTFGTSWGSTYTSTQIIALNGTPVQTTVTNHQISYAVDAYGQMTVPSGGPYDALRIRWVENLGTKTVGYIFLAGNGASVQLKAADTLQPNSGSISVARKSIQWSPPTPLLPVQIVSFTASIPPSGSGVLLEWSTVSEVNNFGFQVERGSEAHGSFQTVAGGFVAGHGTTLVPQRYSWLDGSVPVGTWYYRLNQIDLDGSSHPTDAVRVSVTTGVVAELGPAEFRLWKNYPNPFNPTTTIAYTLPTRLPVTLSIYDVLGRKVATLVDEVQDAGLHRAVFSGSGIASGTYFCRLAAGNFTASQRILLMK
ncbi:MAG: T9SS type A sorting domain-containing protein [Bacteroidota bacterium]